MIRGQLEADEGEFIRQQGLIVSLLPQEVPRERTGTVADTVADGLRESGDDALESDHRVQAVVSRLNLEAQVRFEDLSSGMKRRVLLAKALVTEPDILLLDEPTNHLDIESIRWLEAFLLRSGGTIIFVTHDRVFLEKLATRIVELDRGKLYDWACDYPTFLKRRDELLSAEAKQQELFDKRLAQEETWIRKGIEARRTRNEGRVRGPQGHERGTTATARATGSCADPDSRSRTVGDAGDRSEECELHIWRPPGDPGALYDYSSR